MRAEIIAVGSELLLGQIVNSNAKFLSQKLNELGINVFYHTVVGDNEKRLAETLEIALERSDVVITTGGLGPTMDDLTKETVAELLDRPLILDEPSLEAIRRFFVGRARNMPENNVKQACFPKDALILPNEMGTAPGAVVETENKRIIILPGPPFEMRHMFDLHVVPYLLQIHDNPGEVIISRVLRLYGIGESAVEEKISDLMLAQDNPTIAPLAQIDEINLRITAKGKDRDDATALLQGMVSQLENRLGTVVFGYDDQSLEKVVGGMLKAQGLTISVAESCTGGLVGSKLTDVPGSSEYYKAGIVSYSNQAKQHHLGVKEETLQHYGAVSEETAREMALGVIKACETDIGVGITGIAGPDGDSSSKPVGLVYIAVASNDRVIVRKFKFSGPRTNIKLLSANGALNLTRLYLLSLQGRYSFERGDN